MDIDTLRLAAIGGFFFFNDTATTEIYTLSLHDALPISGHLQQALDGPVLAERAVQHRQHHVDLAQQARDLAGRGDRKSTRLNSSHQIISYAVFCLKKKIYAYAHSELLHVQKETCRDIRR